MTILYIILIFSKKESEVIIMSNYNKNISRYLKNPGKMYIKMKNDELAEF